MVKKVKVLSQSRHKKEQKLPQPQSSQLSTTLVVVDNPRATVSATLIALRKTQISPVSGVGYPVRHAGVGRRCRARVGRGRVRWTCRPWRRRRSRWRGSRSLGCWPPLRPAGSARGTCTRRGQRVARKTAPGQPRNSDWRALPAEKSGR